MAIPYEVNIRGNAGSYIWYRLGIGLSRGEIVERIFETKELDLRRDFPRISGFAMARSSAPSRIRAGLNEIISSLRHENIIEDSSHGLRKTSEALFIQAFGEKVFRKHEIVKAAAETVQVGQRMTAPLAAVLADELMRAGVEVDDPIALRELQRRAAGRNPRKKKAKKNPKRGKRNPPESPTNWRLADLDRRRLSKDELVDRMLEIYAEVPRLSRPAVRVTTFHLVREDGSEQYALTLLIDEDWLDADLVSKNGWIFTYHYVYEDDPSKTVHKKLRKKSRVRRGFSFQKEWGQNEKRKVLIGVIDWADKAIAEQFFISAFGLDDEQPPAAATKTPRGENAAQYLSVVADEYIRAGFEVERPNALKELHRLAHRGTANPSRGGEPLIAQCQKLWEHYCARPGKKRLKEVLSHLETMKSSKSAKVKLERRRCLRAANREAKELGI